MLAGLAGIASAGPNDKFLGAGFCNTMKPPGTVSLPDGTVSAGAAANDDSLLGGQAGPDWGNPSTKSKGKSPDWCALELALTAADGSTEWVMGTGFVAIEWGDDDGMSGPTIMDADDLAVQYADEMSDKDALAAAKAGTLKAPPPLADGTDAAPEATAVILKATTTKKLAAISKDLLLVGSARSQIWTDPAKAKSQLSSWKLDLTIDPKVTSGIDTDTHQAWVFANVTAKKHGKKAAPAITYRVLYGLVYKEKKGKKTWKVGLIHFALVK